MPPFALAIHGGAGAIDRGLVSPEREAAYLEALSSALKVGEALLRKGGSALDAVTETVCSLEDTPLFNAGRGSVYTSNETIEMDAAIMAGDTGNAGAVAAAQTIRNPIRGARLVLESSPHVLLVGQGADDFAKKHGVQLAPPEYFHTETRLEQMRRFRKIGRIDLDHDDDAPNLGTVGAVALDHQGNLCSATSTGGMTNKAYGRVGDSPILGAGTWADNRTCAVSCTGQGEFFMQGAVAHDVHARMHYLGESLEIAAATSLQEYVATKKGRGGLVAVSRTGEVTLPFCSLGMYRGAVSSQMEPIVAIW